MISKYPAGIILFNLWRTIYTTQPLTFLAAMSTTHKQCYCIHPAIILLAHTNMRVSCVSTYKPSQVSLYGNSRKVVLCKHGYYGDFMLPIYYNISNNILYAINIYAYIFD